MKQKYKSYNFHRESLEAIALAEQIISLYDAQGFKLTIRQLYYQMVARGFIQNKKESYDKLSTLMNRARLAGLIDWDAIEDRTRYIRCESHWPGPAAMISAASEQYALDKWDGQPNYVEVWVEKDALIDIVGQACKPLDTPYFSCRGYSSQSEMRSAAQRFISQGHREGRYIIYLGDHDPSGVNMTDDIKKRMSMFCADVQVKRIALTMDQINTYNPPPNMAKESDKRSKDYVAKYGPECWELDALEPQVLDKLITDEVTALLDNKLFNAVVRREAKGRNELQSIHDNYQGVVNFLSW